MIYFHTPILTHIAAESETKKSESRDFLINGSSRRAFCCAFPAFLLPIAREQTARRGFARSGALGLPGAGHGLAACLGVSTRSLSGVLCVGYSSAGILRNSLMGYAPVMLISLSLAIPRPGLFLPCSAQVQLGQFARYCGVTTGLFCPL